nr:DUF2285 domain-containing protein [Bradyrhizobium sacchari]
MAYHQLSPQHRERLALVLRALDGHMDGASYRAIADVFFGERPRLEDARPSQPDPPPGEDWP